ncbi:MAG: polyprenyl synthetase family protein [Bacteroidales bacterium]|nr:polyprenyl synthetase family protein [Candidatus Liminaster caballi]
MNFDCIESEIEQFEHTFESMLRTRVPLADNVIRYFLDRRGKQVRPMLTMLTAKMMSGNVPDETVYGAAAVELLHNATLMHDDVIDKSPMRRGAATINQLWDNRIAVLAGDFFLAKCLMSSNATGLLDVSRILGSIVTELAEGELEQMSNAKSHQLSETSYFSVINGKTASLFSACMQIGGITAGVTSQDVESLGEIGRKIGLIFQIRDDIFDYYPTNSEIGKPTGHDIMEGKVTLPLLYALQHAPSELSSKMLSLLQTDKELKDDDISTLVDFAKAMGGIEYAYARMKNIAFEAKQMLFAFPENESRETISALIDYFVDRKY